MLISGADGGISAGHAASGMDAGTAAKKKNMPAQSEPAIPKTSTPNNDAVNAAKDAAKDGDYRSALDHALNSEGDSVELEIGVSASLPLVIPGTKLGADRSVGVEIERVEDGYELSLSAEQAIELGLEVSPSLNAQVEAGLAAEVTYQFDTVDAAAQGVKDLAITAGNHPAADEAAGLLENAADLADSAANSGVADVLTGAVGNVLAGPVFGRWAGDLIGDQVQRLTRAAEEKTNEFKDAVDGAQDRLKAAYDGYEVSGFVGASATLGLPSPVDVENALKLEGSLATEQRFTTKVNADGTATVSISYSGKASAEGGFVGAGGEGTVKNSVTVSQDVVRNQDGRYVRDGSAEIEFASDVSGQINSCVLVSTNAGGGAKVSYTVEADQLNGELVDAAGLFLQGDTEGALREFGSIEGDLEIQGRITGGVKVSAEAGYLGAKLGLEGELSITDQGQAYEIEDLSLADAMEQFSDQARQWASDVRPTGTGPY